MKEEMLYIPTGQSKLFVHVHYAASFNGRVFLFLNPLFDEKNRTQHLQAQCARAICSLGYHVVRFDYSGTGDSMGESHEMNEKQIINDLEVMVNYLNQSFGNPEINLLGARFGADMAVCFSNSKADIKNLYLIEPVFSGSKFLTEQRIRRKMFHKLNNMDEQLATFNLNGTVCEDFQGYLFRPEFVSFIERLDSLKTPLSGKNIYLYKVDYLFSKKNFNTFSQSFSAANKVATYDVKEESFWDKLEATVTDELTRVIINSIKTHTHHA